MASDLKNRKDLRLKHYDYGLAGAYFITQCTYEKVHLLGHVQDETMYLSDAGKVIALWLHKLPQKFLSIEVIKSVIMPNHVHLMFRVHETDNGETADVTLPRVMQWFKAMTTNAYIAGVKKSNYAPFSKKLWQRSYYDHIVRDDADFERIWTYMEDNIIKWSLDAYDLEGKTTRHL